MLLLVDNGSVFTQNIAKFLLSKKVDFAIIPFDKVSEADFERSGSFILSGRRHNDQKMNAVNSKIINHAISAQKPLLGICYGAEILALTAGGTIRKMDSIQRGPSTVLVTGENPLCGGTISVYQSHSFEISQLGNMLVPLGRSDACRYELVRYGNRAIFGTQFHPEMTDDGLSIIERFVSL